MQSTTRWPTATISGNKNVTGGVQQVQTTSLSSYDSLQVSLSKRFTNGLQFLAAYTHGEAVDYYSGIPENKTHTIMDKWGYTGSACIPMAFHDALGAGKIKRGDKLVLCASGGGLNMAAIVFRY